MDKIFSKIRNGGNYFNTIGKFPVKYIRDLTTGYDSSQLDNKAILPISSSTHMITFFFENGAIVTLRGSGTEPKLKYYSELSGPYSDSIKIQNILNEIVEAVIEHLLKPKFYGLKYPND